MKKGCLTLLLLLSACVQRSVYPAPSSVPSSPSPSPAISLEPVRSPLQTIAPSATASALGIPAGTLKAQVSRNVDGDTIWAEALEQGTLALGATHKIRILEIDTPEIYGETVECYGPEASAFAKQQLPVGSTIYLLADKEDKDRYGRFLRYVWRESGAFYNDMAVRQGFAKAVLYMPNDLYIEQMREAEAEAKAHNRGLWAACSGEGPNQSTAPPPPPSGANCHASYPDFCIAPPPPDLDCADFSQKNFTVRWDVADPDPHGLDGDKDGKACES